MEKVDYVEENVSHSFKRVKADIIRLQDEFMQLREAQIRLLRRIGKLEEVKPVREIKVVEAKKAKKTTKKTVKKVYIASKEGKKFHLSNCPYAKNIKPKTKVKFKSKDAALNKGYKPCSCVK